jgi:hypothetical protein
MVTGQQKQLIKQVGEYLVAAELCRRELIATSFTGNVPVFDIIAITNDEKMKTIQVKTTTTNSGWNLEGTKFLDFEHPVDNKQHIKGFRILSYSDTIFCFVILRSFGKEMTLSEHDEFYLVPVKELQAIVRSAYERHLKKMNFVRKNDSHHVKLKPSDISRFKNNWDCLLK